MPLVAWDIHSNPGPSSGTQKFGHINNILYIIATVHDFFSSDPFRM